MATISYCSMKFAAELLVHSVQPFHPVLQQAVAGGVAALVNKGCTNSCVQSKG